MSLVPSLRFGLWIVGVLALLLGLIVTAIVVTMWPWLRPPPTYRFPIPPGTALTEPIAIEFSQKALAADGKEAAAMRPIPYNDKGGYFAANTIDPNNGYVQWMTPQGSYGVGIEKKGQQIVCQVYRSK
jgi:hypothetical protein